MKKGVYFQVNEEDYDTYRKLQIHILRLHKKIGGVLGHEILRLAYSNPEITEKIKKIEEPKFKAKTKENLLTIYSKLRNNSNYNEKNLDSIIEEFLGRISVPTKRNYKNIMKRHGLIIPTKGGSYIKGEVLPPWLKEADKNE